MKNVSFTTTKTEEGRKETKKENNGTNGFECRESDDS